MYGVGVALAVEDERAFRSGHESVLRDGAQRPHTLREVASVHLNERLRGHVRLLRGVIVIGEPRVVLWAVAVYRVFPVDLDYDERIEVTLDSCRLPLGDFSCPGFHFAVYFHLIRDLADEGVLGSVTELVDRRDTVLFENGYIACQKGWNVL